MTNEELKKKIVDILEETEYEWTEEKNGYILQIFYDKLADALIAAGIGDVKKEKFEADHYWNMWQGALVELERAEHRAEVAERALKDMCEEYEDNFECDLYKECNSDKPCYLCDYKVRLQKAAREIEEGKGK